MTRRTIRALGLSWALGWLGGCGQATPVPDAGQNNVGFALQLTGLAPTSGPLDGGTLVTVSGSGFAAGLTLSFGGVAASQIQIESPSSLTALTPHAASPGPVDVVATLPAGSATLPGGFTYEGALADGGSEGIAYCSLHFPPALTAPPGVEAGPVYGWVYVPGVTDQGSAQGPGVKAEVGFGAVGSTPDSTWSWASAAWDAKVGTSNHDDEYQGLLPAASSPGAYAFAVRFSRNDGGTFVNCDTGGDTPTMTYAPAKAGVLTVATPVVPAIGYCAVHFPTTLSANVGEAAGPVYGWVYAQGVTDQGSTAGPGIAGQLGEGPLGSLPDGTWSWVAASWDAKRGPAGHNDEYMASLPPQDDAGVFAYAFRFALADAGFVNCDTAGDPAYDAGAQGVLTVSVPFDAGPQVAYCNVQYPDSLLGEAFSQSTSVYGEVYQPGVTDDAGQGPGITAQAGFGPLGADPSTDGGGWTWVSAAYLGDVAGLTPNANDEYAATLRFGDAGAFAMAYRFSLSGGSYRYCDAAGDAVYSPTNQATLTVAPAPLLVDWCDLQFPTALALSAGEDAGPVYGQVYKKGVTDSPGQGADVWGQLGVGPSGADPSSATSGFTWAPATYDGDRNGSQSCTGSCPNDEYQASLIAPAAAGSYDFYFRFSMDDGLTWTLCGVPGPLAQDGGPGVLTVSGVDAGADAGLDAGTDAGLVNYCVFQYPASLLGETGTQSTNLYGVVYQPGVTDDAGQGPGITGEVGIGPLGSDPTSAAGWSWSPASYYSDYDGLANDEYAGTLLLPAPGSYALAYRFSLDRGASWRACDLAGDATYLPANQATASVVAAPLTVDWCDLQYPPALTAAPGQDAGLIYGQVYKSGVTNGPGQAPDILGQLGVGPAAGNPSLPDAGFVWVAATYDGDRNGNNANCGTSCPNDEYAAPLIAPAAAGSYAYYFRFSEDDGNVWTVCGYQNPLTLGGDAGVLTVP